MSDGGSPDHDGGVWGLQSAQNPPMFAVVTGQRHEMLICGTVITGRRLVEMREWRSPLRTPLKYLRFLDCLLRAHHTRTRHPKEKRMLDSRCCFLISRKSLGVSAHPAAKDRSRPLRTHMCTHGCIAAVVGIDLYGSTYSGPLLRFGCFCCAASVHKCRPFVLDLGRVLDGLLLFRPRSYMAKHGVERKLGHHGAAHVRRSLGKGVSGCECVCAHVPVVPFQQLVHRLRAACAPVWQRRPKKKPAALRCDNHASSR